MWLRMKRTNLIFFWRDHSLRFSYDYNEKVYVFSSMFAPTNLEISIIHRWQWYNENTDEWEIIEDITYEITGGRDGGYRGYTYKDNAKKRLWKVAVITEEELILGVIVFEIVMNTSTNTKRMVEKRF